VVEEHTTRVIRFYDTHPINEQEILSKLAAKGVSLDALTEEELKEFDQDHYGGFTATDRLAEAAGIQRGHRVLDVCSGLGGPARWLAWVHIADKGRLLTQCRRVLKANGLLAFTDIVSCEPLTAGETRQLADEMQFPPIVTARDYLETLESSGFTVERHDDLSDDWRDILVARLEMYRSLRDTTVARFGQQHFDKWDRMYSAFVALYVAGKLGGARILASAKC